MGGQGPTWTALVPNNTVPIACTTQQTTVQNSAKESLTWKRLVHCRPQLEESSDALTSCIILSRTHFVLVILLRWVSNCSKVKAHSTVACCYSSQAAICKNRHCKRHLAKKQSLKKPKNRHLHDYLMALSNTQKNATHGMPHNIVVTKIISILCIVHELEHLEKKN